MRYRRAVEKLRTLAEACEAVKNWPPGDPFLLEAYVFGDVHVSYWDHDSRREHRGSGRYPEHHLWEAVQGYLDLYDAAESEG